MKLLNKQEAITAVGGTHLKAYLGGYTYSQLVDALGEPTFPEPSGDDKIQKEWVFTYKGEVFTIYDWKTYDEEYTTTRLYSWNVGGKTPAYDFIEAIENKLNKQ